MIEEKEVVLTFLLQLRSERGILDRRDFKGGTWLRKMFLGNQGRFSTDLDFTGLEEHDHEDVILDMMAAFEQPFHGFQFGIPEEGYYETQDGLSWGVNPTHTHDRNQGGSEIMLQIGRREMVYLGASIPPTRTTGTRAAAKSCSRSAGGKRHIANRAARADRTKLFPVPPVCAGRTDLPRAR